MTVAELMEQLATLPLTSPVLVRNKDGYLSHTTKVVGTAVRPMKHYPDCREASRVSKGDDAYYGSPVDAVVVAG
jgi:hypothetical protein